MRKFILGLLATLFSVVLVAGPASAESQETMPDDKMSEPEKLSSPVDCVFNDYQAAYAKAEQPYMVDDLIRFEITLSDPDSVVSIIRFNASINQKGWTIQEDTTPVAYWTAPSAGEWLISAQLFDSSGQEIIPTGNCSGAVSVLQMTDPAHPDHPDEWEMPEEPVEPAHPDHPDEVELPEEPPVEANPCAGIDPSDIVNVTNEDGSVTAYTPDGVWCAHILNQGTIVARPSEPAAVVPAAAMSQLPRTGVKDDLPLYGAGLVLIGSMFVIASKRYRCVVQ